MTIQLFQPTVGWREAWAVAKVLRSRWIGPGPLAARFQEAWAAHLGVNPDHVILCHSCTEALFQAVALFTQPRDLVLVPDIHFIGAGNAVLGQGRRLALCDVNPRTLMPDLGHFFPAARNVKATILLHYGGMAMRDIVPIIEECCDRGIAVIEDAACGPATRTGFWSMGTLGDLGCWSFDSMKVMASGDAGAICVRDIQKANRLRLLLENGLRSAGRGSARKRWWEYRVREFGRSSHMNDITAAILLCQLKRLPQLVARRKAVSALYDELLGGLPWLTTRLPGPHGTTDSHYFYWVQTGWRDALATWLRQNGVYCSYRYYPLHRAYGIRRSFPGAEEAAATTLLLPCHANLTKENVVMISDLIYRFGKALP